MAAAIAGASPSALAAGFATARFGGEHGNVVTTNPTALYFNPGAIGFSEGLHVFVDGTLVLRQATWTHARAPTDPPDPAGGEGANTGQARLFNVFGAPAAAATMRLGRFVVGIGGFVPFGGRESWDKNPRFDGSPFPLAADGVQRWHIIEGALTFAYATAGVAYRIGPVSIGLAANLVVSSVSFSKAKNPSGMQAPDTAQEGRANLDVSGINGSFGVGVMAEAIPDRLWLGASYQSQPGVGPQTLTGTLALPSIQANYKVVFTEALPDIIRAGARLRLRDHVELRLFGDFTRWSVLRTQCIGLQGMPCSVLPDGSPAGGSGVLENDRRDWNDTYAVRAGVSGWIGKDVEIFAGAGFETAATPDSTLEPGLADADSIQGALGGRFHIADSFYLAVSYTHLQFLDRDNTGSSVLADAAVPTRQQDGGGRYTQWVGLFDLNVEKTF